MRIRVCLPQRRIGLRETGLPPDMVEPIGLWPGSAFIEASLHLRRDSRNAKTNPKTEPGPSPVTFLPSEPVQPQP